MIWQPVALLGAALVAPGALLHATPADSAIAELYERGLRGNEQAVVDCISALEAKLAVQPNDQLARVYLGSAWTLRSRDLAIGPGKLSALRKGLTLMDAAAAAAPDNAEVLLLRAVTNEALPVFLGQRKVARAQLDELLDRLEKGSAKLKPADQQLLYLNAGEAAKRAGDKERARELWRRGAALKADAKLTQEITAALTQP
jgi:tetratricopeptide (TPR) repeat protein